MTRPTARARALLPALALVLLSPSASHPQASELAEAVRGRIDRDALMTHAREITRHERPSGSAGENAAIDYIVATLRAAGVPVEVHTFRAFTSDPVAASVVVPGTGVSPEAITVSFSAEGEIEAPLVDVGSLDDLPGLEPGTGERLVLEGSPARPGAREPALPAGFPDVAGRVALVDGQPRGAPVVVLERLGAAGVIFANPEERLNDLIVTTTWGTPSLRNYHRLPAVPVAEVKRSGGEALRARLAAGPVTVRLAAEVRTGWTPLRLAVARIEPGAGDGDGDAPFVLFGGHIDGWYHGATDEGASNAAMVELARAFYANRDRLRRGLVVAWWPGHSNARYGGSTWFADREFDALRRSAVAHVNVDGIGQRGAKRFSAAASSALEGLALDVLRDGTDEAAPRSFLPGRNSDQSFNGAGLPLLQLYHTRLEEDGGYWWWHTPEDTYDKISADVLLTDTRLYADALARLLADPVLPVSLEAEAAALGAHLERRRGELGGAGGVELDEPARLQQALLERARRLDRALATAAPGPALDRAILDVLRPIHRVVYVPVTPWHPDPGVDWDPLPGLAPAGTLATAEPGSDRYGFALTTLVRERNRLVEALETSIRAADALMARLEEGR